MQSINNLGIEPSARHAQENALGCSQPQDSYRNPHWHQLSNLSGDSFNLKRKANFTRQYICGSSRQDCKRDWAMQHAIGDLIDGAVPTRCNDEVATCFELLTCLLAG